MIQKKIVGLLVSSLLFIYTTPAYADVHVNGYTKKDGTYVPPHYRSDPDRNFNNNWSTKGNTNPHTGKEGTKTHPSPDSYTGNEGILTYPNHSVGNEYNPQISTPNIDTEQFEEIQKKATEDFIKQQNEVIEKYKGNEYNPQISTPKIDTKQFEEIQKKATEDFITQLNEIMKKNEGNNYNQQISTPNIDTEQFGKIKKKATEDFIKQLNEIMKKNEDDLKKQQDDIMKKYEGDSKQQQDEIDKLLKQLDEVGDYTPPIISNTSTDTTNNNQTNTQETKHNQSVDSVSTDISTIEKKVSEPDKPSLWDNFINFIKGII